MALDVLAAARVPATFFMIGKLVADYSSIAKQVVAAGHEVGNHSWSHVSAPTVSDERNVSEIDRSTDMIKSVTGVTPAWYRPPRGMLVGASVRRAHEQGQAVAMWSVTRGPGSIGDSDAGGVAKYLIDTIHPGAVDRPARRRGRVGLRRAPAATTPASCGAGTPSSQALPVGHRGVEGGRLPFVTLSSPPFSLRADASGLGTLARVDAEPLAAPALRTVIKYLGSKRRLVPVLARGARDLRRVAAPSTSSPAPPAWPRRGARPGPR